MFLFFGKKEKPYKAPVADTISKKKTSDYDLDNILFALLLVIGFGYFSKFKKNKRNINLGIDVDRKDNPGARKKHGYDSPGTVKNGKRRVAGIIHVIVYVGFIIINIELLNHN
jgi:hypothetical protein